MARVAFGQFSARRNSLAAQHCSDCSKATPTPVFRYFKRQFIVDTALHTVQLLIMRIMGLCIKRIAETFELTNFLYYTFLLL